MSGSITIARRRDGAWVLTVGDRRPRCYPTLDDALAAAGDISFAPGQLPGSWRVRIDEG